ncbi:type II secretion system minor pseudopilin GspK [Psychromarinibacter sp. S121]|uniref:type II secretion system minor pseudopilin GspK n=1 Tax=Psychromarinibacter sp. S121 TaxID=3415127 RepID=UPI003C7C68A7
MRNDRGMVLLNALIVVLVLASVSAALLTRSGAAMMRAASVQDAEQLDHHLDAAESLVRLLLADTGRNGQIVHTRQDWAAGDHLYRIGDGQVRIRITDLQGRMNVNWLAGAEDALVEGAFAELFRRIDLPLALLDEIRDYLAPGGPRSLPVYLRRSFPVQPRGGAASTIEDLRLVNGFDATAFATLSDNAAALPWDTRVNVNTAPAAVLEALLAPFPAEVRTEFLRPDREGPVEHMKELRDLAIAVLETEDLSGLPLDRMTVSSSWFAADIHAEHEGRVASRRVILHRERLDDVRPSVVYRWALPD